MRWGTVNFGPVVTTRRIGKFLLDGWERFVIGRKDVVGLEGWIRWIRRKNLVGLIWNVQIGQRDVIERLVE